VQTERFTKVKHHQLLAHPQPRFYKIQPTYSRTSTHKHRGFLPTTAKMRTAAMTAMCYTVVVDIKEKLMSSRHFRTRSVCGAFTAVLVLTTAVILPAFVGGAFTAEAYTGSGAIHVGDALKDGGELL
jgi:hypothetical protein